MLVTNQVVNMHLRNSLSVHSEQIAREIVEGYRMELPRKHRYMPSLLITICVIIDQEAVPLSREKVANQNHTLGSLCSLRVQVHFYAR